MRINTNLSAINSQRILAGTNSALGKSMAKLSSGFRINRAADDAAGLGIANKLRSDVRSLTQANRNAEQAGTVLQIAEGATSSIQSMLERMKDLATQAASDNVDDSGRLRIQDEFDALRSEIDRTVNTTKFQGKKLLDNSFGNSVNTSSTVLGSGKSFQEVKIAGATAASYTLTNPSAGNLVLTNGSVSQTVATTANGQQTVNFSQFGISVSTTSSYNHVATTAEAAGNITVTQGSGGGSFLVSSSGAYSSNDLISLSAIDIDVATLGLTSSTVTGASGAQTTLATLDTAIARVATALGDIGAAQNQVEYAIDNLKTTIQNYSAAESVIRDVDMAEEMTHFSKNQILAQAGTAMLAQANQLGQGVLQLLRG